MPSGVYHATSGGQTSWFEFAQAIASTVGVGDVRPTTSDTLVRPAPRPSYSVLGHSAWRAVGIEPIGPWRDRWNRAAEGVLA